MDIYEETFDTYDRLAQIYEDRFMEVTIYNESYDRFLELLPLGNARVFEIGCGPGNITRYLLSKRPDLSVFGIDGAPAMIERAKKNNPAAHFEVMDARLIDRLEEKYDGIIAGFCLPYFPKEDCEKLIGDCADLLTENGAVYFSFVEGDYGKSHYQKSSDGTYQVFFHYHTIGFLQEIMERNGFGSMSILRVPFERPGGLTEIHSVLAGVKN